MGVTDFYQRDSDIFLREITTARQFPNLSWRWHGDIPVLKGIYQFRTEYRGILFMDSFNLEINFPHDYPENIPLIKELDKKIPDTFHRFTNGLLCLCTPAEQCLIFSKEPTLEGFIKNLVNPYLLSWLWYERFNEMPWGERKHGSLGLIESYQELLRIKNPKNTFLTMKKFLMNEINARDECPCGSGLLFKKCHKSIMIKLVNNLPKGQIQRDFITILGG